MPEPGLEPQAGPVTRWMALLFVVGSACFALGAAPSYAVAVGAEADAVTFFVGSLFFTTAGTLQWISWRVDPDRQRLDGWAAAVQWVGTVFFNISTFAAMNEQLTAAGGGPPRVDPRRPRVDLLPRVQRPRLVCDHAPRCGRGSRTGVRGSSPR